MPNPFDNITDSDIAYANAHTPGAAPVAAFGTEADPVKAAQAVNLSNATGTPAQVIAQDPEAFRQKVNAQAAGAVVNANPQLRQYATSDPMKAQVSARDWGNLDDYSKAAAQIPKESFWDKWAESDEPVAATIGSIGQALTSTPQGMDRLTGVLNRNLPESLKWAGATEAITGTATLGYQLGSAGLAAGGGLFEIAAKSLATAAGHFGLDPAKVLHELEGMGESEMGRSAIHAINPYIEGKIVPGRYVHPVVEALRKAESTDATAKIKAAYNAAQPSETKALVPEYFRDLAEQHHEAQTIGISPEIVEKLYGGTEPEVGDGILGFIPDLKAQMEISRSTGADIQVPLTDMMTHMDPEVFKVAEEGIRPFPDGYTSAEEPRVGSEVDEAKYPDNGIGEVYNGHTNVRTPDLIKDTGARGNFAVPDWYAGIKSIIDDLSEKLGLPVTPRLWVGEHSNPNKMGYASSDGHIVLNSNLEEHKAVAVALHELGHQVQYQRFNNLPSADKASILAAWKKDRAAAEDQTTRQWRPISYAGSQDLPIKDLHPGNREYLTKFTEWFAEQTQRWITKTEEPTNFVERFFKGIADAWKKIYDAVKGHQEVAPSMNDFLHGLWGSERPPIPISARNAPVHIRIFKDRTAIEMSKDHWSRYEKLLEEQFDEEYKANLARATLEEKKRLAPEWAAKREEMRKKVVEDFDKVPRLMADKALRDGDIGPIASDALTPEEKAALPQSYHSKFGKSPDEVAAKSGYQTGRQLLDDLMDYHKDRGDMNPEEYRRRLISQETERRVEQEHGTIEDNAVAAAQARTTRETMLDALHEELVAMAKEHGFDMPFSREQITRGVKAAVAKETMGSLSVKAARATIDRVNAAIENGLLKGDIKAAFAERQRKFMAKVTLAELERIEKVKAGFEKTLKKYDSRQVHPETQEYTDAIHMLMAQVGRKIPRSLADVVENMRKNGYSNLNDFATQKFNDGFQEIALPDFLRDPSWHDQIKNMTVKDFEGFARAVKSIDFAERDSRKVLVGAEKMDRAAFRGQAIDRIKSHGPAGKYTTHQIETLVTKLKKTISSMGWGLIQMETVCKQLDRGEPNGLFTRAWSHLAIDAANYADRLKLGIQEALHKASKIENDSKKLPNVLFKVNGVPLDLTRRNLRGIIANMGNTDNWTRLTEGWKVDPEAVKAWVREHSTKEDWVRAQAQGDIFNDLFKKADNMRHATTGVGIERLELGAVDDPFNLGLKGWYNPATYYKDLMESPKVRDKSKPLEVLPEGLTGGDYWSVNPRGTYAHERTDFRGPIALDTDSMPVFMRMMAHDIAMRPALIQMKKIVGDRAIMLAMKSHFSETAADMFEPYLNDMAGANKIDPAATSRLNRFFGQFLKNTAMAEIAFKLSTPMKHGASALVNSAFRSGIRFVPDALTLGTESPEAGKSWWKFALDTSHELFRRQRGLVATEALDSGLVLPGEKEGVDKWITTLRDVTQREGTRMISSLDLASAVPTWVTEFKKQMALSPFDKGNAVRLADAAVRDAHGSTSLASKPEFMRANNPFMKGLTVFYNFFNEVLNKQYEMLWRAKYAAGLFKSSDFNGARTQIKESSLILARVLTLGAIEEYFTGEDDPNEGWGHKLARALGYTFTAGIPYVRDVAHAFISGHEVSVASLLSAGPQAFVNLAKDVTDRKPYTSFFNQKFANDMAMGTTSAFGIGGPGLLHAAEYGHGMLTGQEYPRSFPEFVRGMSQGPRR